MAQSMLLSHAANSLLLLRRWGLIGTEQVAAVDEMWLLPTFKGWPDVVKKKTRDCMDPHYNEMDQNLENYVSFCILAQKTAKHARNFQMQQNRVKTCKRDALFSKMQKMPPSRRRATPSNAEQTPSSAEQTPSNAEQRRANAEQRRATPSHRRPRKK
eukprot:6489802-Amphidinium_carterae.1